MTDVLDSTTVASATTVLINQNSAGRTRSEENVDFEHVRTLDKIRVGGDQDRVKVSEV